MWRLHVFAHIKIFLTFHVLFWSNLFFFFFFLVHYRRGQFNSCCCCCCCFVFIIFLFFYFYVLCATVYCFWFPNVQMQCMDPILYMHSHIPISFFIYFLFLFLFSPLKINPIYRLMLALLDAVSTSWPHIIATSLFFWSCQSHTIIFGGPI